jgi:hypothetical protein
MARTGVAGDGGGAVRWAGCGVGDRDAQVHARANVWGFAAIVR